jgi:hypothetical protein
MHANGQQKWRTNPHTFLYHKLVINSREEKAVYSCDKQTRQHIQPLNGHNTVHLPSFSLSHPFIHFRTFVSPSSSKATHRLLRNFLKKNKRGGDKKKGGKEGWLENVKVW